MVHDHDRMLVGALAGYLGGMVDDLLMRSVDITLTVPFFAVVLVLTAAFPSARSPVGVALLIALSSWMALARIVRAQFLGEHGRGRHPGRVRPGPHPPALTATAGACVVTPGRRDPSGTM